MALQRMGFGDRHKAGSAVDLAGRGVQHTLQAQFARGLHDIERALDVGIGQVINIGSNYEVSVGDTDSLIADLMGREVEFTSDEQRLRPAGSEVERLWADNTLARELAGWAPEFAGLDGLRRGLRNTIDWFGMPENLRRYKAGLYNI